MSKGAARLFNQRRRVVAVHGLSESGHPQKPISRRFSMSFCIFAAVIFG
jgi:hypothetical protein